MKGQVIQPMLEEMVRAILQDRPGQVRLGNVLMEWNGSKLLWDTPVREWDVEGVWRSIMKYAQMHPEVEGIAICAEALANL